MAKVSGKLKQLPIDPGVYFFKDAKGKIIYVGKAAVLKNRVKSYFLAGTVHGPKNQVMLTEIADVDWITVGSEVEALFLESEFIKRYRPKFNIDLKDEKQFNYVKISADEFPVISYVRRPLDDKATYFGPFTSSDAMKRAMRLLRRVFPYVTHERWPERGCLQYHLGLCPGPEENAITAVEYRKNIRQLVRYLRGERAKLVAEFEREMKAAARRKDYEAAARARDRLRDMLSLSKQMVFGDKESFDLTKDQALAGLAERLGIPIPRRIEAYDISHIQGSDNVASMIVFTDGVANRDQYRRFKMKLRGNDDFAHMREVIRRRFSKLEEKDWPAPDLILIDGGKGQLAAALEAMAEKGIDIPAIGLAKREEEIIRKRSAGGSIARVPNRSPKDEGSLAEGTVPANNFSWRNASHSRNEGDFEIILLPKSSHVLQLLQRVRDEAHRFAVTYHALLRGKRQTGSQLDEVPGVGPATRKKLVKAFGSVAGVKSASLDELAAVVGPGKARVVSEYLQSAK